MHLVLAHRSRSHEHHWEISVSMWMEPISDTHHSLHVSLGTYYPIFGICSLELSEARLFKIQACYFQEQTPGIRVNDYFTSTCMRSSCFFHSVDVKMLKCGRLCSVQTRSSATIVQYRKEKALIKPVKAAPSKILLTKCNP